MDIQGILDDKRPIASICWNTEDGATYEATRGYTIEAYGEPGIHCNLPYFAVSKDGVIICRVPAWQVSVHYAAS